MKINWGTGLVIGMLAFISFIMYFVVTMLSSTDYDHDLVTEDYYRAELYYQQDINAEKNALAMKEQIQVKTEGNKLVVQFPETMDLQEMEGIVSFYRPSNKMLDFQIPFKELIGNSLIVPEEKLVKGRWNININWTNRDKDFLFKKEIIY